MKVGSHGVVVNRSTRCFPNTITDFIDLKTWSKHSFFYFFSARPKMSCDISSNILLHF